LNVDGNRGTHGYSGLNSYKLLSMLMETVVRMAILKVNYNRLHLTDNK